MLVALELAGFKSFADRTRFDFPDGITVVVGPNGSGKSNVVDAIKWVLGAQSAKALRGKDMIDVIFKGSSDSGRKPCNSAEATLVFDNSEKLLPLDTEEVQVTRRVYRSGEGEYQINGSACRLKDIKNLFRGTGVGVDAYSLIEQGKVDRMLQASPKDRRVIFEEAAGISRFNAKKAEAARRLARVDQNLTRLKDIVDEVYTRLNRLKNQASKAQRYREMSDRMHQLRLRLGWTQYSQLAEQVESHQAQLAEIQSEIDSYDSELAEAKTAAEQSEMDLHAVASKCQDVEARLQERLQQIAVQANQQAALRSRIEDLGEEQQRYWKRLASLRQRTQTLETEYLEIEEHAALAELEYEEAKQQAATKTQHADLLRNTIKEEAGTQERLREDQVDLLKIVSDKTSAVGQQQNLLAQSIRQIEAANTRCEELLAAEDKARSTAKRAAAKLNVIHDENTKASELLSRAGEELDGYHAALKRHAEEAAGLQGRLEGAGQRLEILQELQRHLDGVDAGARHVLELARDSNNPLYRSVKGLVAELLSADMNLAPLIDTALGQRANALVLDDGGLFQEIKTGKLTVPGRLSLLRLDRLPNRRYGEKVQLDGVGGVLGRADRLVKAQAEMEPLVRYLLGTTWLVESLDVALELQHFRGANLRFVTKSCELVDADGMLTIGQQESSTGLVSRKSEIAESQQEIEDCKLRHQKCQGEIALAQTRIDTLQPKVRQLETNAKRLDKELARQQASAQNAIARLDELEAAHNEARSELEILTKRKAELEPNIEQLASEVDSGQKRLSEIEQQLQQCETKVRQSREQLDVAGAEETTAKVAFARAEQKVESARGALEQATRARRERRLAIDETQQELDRIANKVRAAELEILTITSQQSEDYLHAEKEEAALDKLAVEAGELRTARSQAAKHLDSMNRKMDKLAAARQTAESNLQRDQSSAEELVKRFTEDYQIDYEALSEAELIADDEERVELDTEASQLRQDIASVGEINMSALAELDELQQRYDHLNGQYEDLVAAKESLQRIIHKINADSRKMFLETLEIIRTNFQKLYRKSFGGGSADIVLEEGEDVLECGIDIVATPPGKTALSNSLLSGGEKALTAVALLLAIFQYRPSPFCVLDEVDAPFDEANIGRFVSVLTEFLDWTKFIIVTHSKKTMTASTTLYGVTMQESGVSKQVAVRFEDVNDKGEIVSDTKKAA
ncbi:MAG TPA: chromosome segregation protein SMC [Planctomycetaceae bacterium]|nr:chromosome segregation protein SMC [Planctomycetaceae bacterium]